MSLEIPETLLSSLTSRTQECLLRLKQHEAEEVDLSGRPNNKLAAVLALLYEKDGHLRVLLTTRSKTLRSHPGQTALPGGKVDDTDGHVVETASPVYEIESKFREAFEEVGLPLASPHIHTICTLRPFVSSSKLFVTPVVALLTDISILDNLTPCEGEVDRIFNHPLEAILDPEISRPEPLVEKGGADWPYDVELHSTTDVELPWLSNSTYRMHRFRSSASPIKGLTAEILIMTASIAYDKDPTYPRYAPRQFTNFNAVLRILDAQDAEPSRVGTPVGVPTGNV